MKVVIYGGNGELGPHVVKALEGEHTLRITDVNDLDTDHEYRKVDVANSQAVLDAAEGMDAIVNLSVLRWDRKIAFDVNTMGCYNVMTAAIEHGIQRVINTGPHYTVAGPAYEEFDYAIGPDVPPQPGTLLYGHTKSLGHEITRVFAETHGIQVLTLLFYEFLPSEGGASPGRDLTPYSISWADAGEAFRYALTVDEGRLDSKCEPFFVFTDLPHGKFSNEKVKRVLGWRPTDFLDDYWHKPSANS